MKITTKLILGYFIFSLIIGFGGYSLFFQSNLGENKITTNVIGINPSDVESRIKNKSFSVSMIITIILFSSIIAGTLTSRLVLKPLHELKKATKSVNKRGIYKKIKIKSKDELGEISGEINNMAQTLKKSGRKKLALAKTKNKKLEDAVKERTVKLDERVKDLNLAKRAMFNIMEDMERTNEKFREMDKIKSNFLNIVSHELKTPLTAMFAHLDVLDDFKKNLDKQELKSMEALRRNSNQLKMLIENILEISRIEAGKFELNYSKIDLKELITEVIDNLKVISKQKNIKIISDIKPIPQIQADEMRIREILNNLIGNSIKFTEKGFIKIEAKKAENFIEINVIDTGIGIPKNKINNLFQKFYQVDSSLGRRYGGTGLGLSITKQLVELQKGKISLESEFGKGTKFSVKLPLKRAKEINSKNLNNKKEDLK